MRCSSFRWILTKIDKRHLYRSSLTTPSAKDIIMRKSYANDMTILIRSGATCHLVNRVSGVGLRRVWEVWAQWKRRRAWLFKGLSSDYSPRKTVGPPDTCFFANLITVNVNKTKWDPWGRKWSPGVSGGLNPIGSLLGDLRQRTKWLELHFNRISQENA